MRSWRACRCCAEHHVEEPSLRPQTITAGGYRVERDSIGDDVRCRLTARG
jgi:hypothetical protein